MSFRHLPLADPDAMRALGHAGRLAIFLRLSLDGPATATECAEVAGLSPSACSYHLRALARCGFVEEAPGGTDGRERRWQATTRGISLRRDSTDQAQDPADPDRAAAERVLLDQALQTSYRAVSDYLDHQADHEPAWRGTALVMGMALHLTRDEFTELSQQIQVLLAPYERADPAARPPDAKRVLWSVQAVPWRCPDRRSSSPVPARGTPPAREAPR